MAFRKGVSGNPKGRPAGAKDKKSEQLREWLMGIFKKHRDTLAEDLAAVDPATRWNIIAKLLPYILPRLNAVTIAPECSNEPLVIVEVPCPDEYKDYHPASSEEEVQQMIEQDSLKRKAIEEGRGVIEVATQLEKDAIEKIAAQNNARRVQQRRSGIIRQY